MPNTYTLLETITVGAAGASSVTFNSIPQTGYTDLVIKFSGRNTADSSQTLITLNGSTSTYTGKRLYGSGSAATSDAGNTANFNPSSAVASTYTANTFGNAEIYIPNYTSSNFKSVSIDGVTENNATTAFGGIFAGLWSTTSAITSVSLAANSGNWAQYSTFSLYGVSALGVTPTKAPKATGGSIIQTDGTYWYHAFLSSGTFTPATALTCDVLVVAGGGGGGMRNNGGGGGAGGVLAFASQSIGTSAQTVTVGGGGAINGSGSNSQFAALTASVGGGNGGSQSGTANGGNGGSGGGAGWTGTAGTATSGQGNAGGTSNNGTYLANGGGGGAGAAGGNGNATTGAGGAGGAGVNTVTNWGALSSALTTLGLGVSGYIAGGGGGSSSLAGGQGTAGSGGGTAGTSSTASSNATPNTGSGAGGVSTTSVTAGLGGSGVVIVRYLA
jgi:hypothetical protein